MTSTNESVSAVPSPPKGNGYKNDHKHVSISLPDDQMFQRLMIGRIARQKELLISGVSGKEYIGFVIGWDAEWLQITTTEGQMVKAIQMMNVVSVEETGIALWNITTLSQEEKDNIERYTAKVYELARKAQDTIYGPRNNRTHSTPK